MSTDITIESIDSKSQGACCRFFLLGFSPEEMWKNYQLYLLNQADSNVGWPEDQNELTDVHIVAPMLIYRGYLTGQEVHDYCKRRGLTIPTNVAIDSGPACYYTCRHLNKETSECGIYNARPDVCRRYPERNACAYPGCDVNCDGGKLKRQEANKE